jgi:hypothetical protein
MDVVVLWESSRGGRELEEWAAFLNACRRTGTGIYITTHGRLYDMANGRDWRSLAEDGVDSAYESEKTSVRIRRHVAAGPVGNDELAEAGPDAVPAELFAYVSNAYILKSFAMPGTNGANQCQNHSTTQWR